jgi:hypothetical protein
MYQKQALLSEKDFIYKVRFVSINDSNITINNKDETFAMVYLSLTPLRNEPQYLLNRRLVRPHSHSDCVREEKNHFYP